jgi:hypothetical protein
VKVEHSKRRGKLDPYNKYAPPAKDIYLYPSTKDFGAVSSSGRHEYPGIRARQTTENGLGEDDHT